MKRLMIVVALIAVPVVVPAAAVWPPSVSLSNGFVYVAPLLAWNAIFWRAIRIDRFFEGEAPKALLAAEFVARAFVFTMPVFLVTEPESRWFTAGLGTYLAGTALYCGSWLVLAYGDEIRISGSPLLQLAPAYTPFLSFAGLALMARSPEFAIGAGLFTVLHVAEYLMKRS